MMQRASRLCEDPLEDPGGVGLGPVHAAGKVSAEALECVAIDVHEPGGASLDANAEPVSTKGAASVELFGVAKKAATTEPEALEPRAEGEAWCMLETPPREAPRRASVGMTSPCERARPRANAGQSGHHERRGEWAHWLCRRAHRLPRGTRLLGTLKKATLGH
jgi:hypothetical protein